MDKFITFIKNTGRALKLGYSFAPKVMVGIFAITITTALAPLFQAKLLGVIVDKIVVSVQNNISITGILTLVCIYAAVWGGTRIAHALELYLEKIWYVQNEQGLELTVLKKRTEIDLGHYENPEFQNLLTRAFNRSFWPVFELADAQFQMFASLVVIIVSSMIASAINPLVYVIVIISSIPSFVVQFKYGYKVWSIWGEHSERQRKYASLRHHVVSRTGVTQIKLLQNSPRIFDYILEIMNDFKRDQLMADRTRFIMESIAALILALGFGLSLFLIVNDVVNGNQNVGTLVFIVSVLGSLVMSMNQFLRQLGVQMEKSFYATDIFTILDTKPYIVRSNNPVKLSLKEAPHIEFKNVSFKYEGREDWILKDISLNINPGEKIALVGMNGAGKSTFVKLLARIYDPTEGEIFVNGINLKEIDVDEWGTTLAVLLQDYLNYDLIAKESIGMGRIERIDDELVKNAAKYSGASEFIEGWEKQYDQQIGKEFEGGIEPSKGQNQKIALARILYRDALIVVLDEPTAAIDALSEMEIFENMEKAVGKNTLLVITHRFNTTQSLDRIIVLDKGKLVETGTHKELLKYGGLYKEMYESQAKAFRSDSKEQE